MSFKKSIQTVLLGFVLCFCLLVGIGQNPILAATLLENRPILQEKMQAMPEKTVNLESAIDRFLTSIPAGYYTIATVEGLKNLVVPQIMVG